MKPAADAAPSPVGRRSKGPGARLRLPTILPPALILALTLGCGEAPTEPSLQVPTPPPPVPLDLNGEWTGTFSGGRCATPEAIRVRLSHVEDRLRGMFHMSCLSADSSVVELRGQLGDVNSLGASGHVSLLVNDQTVCIMTGGGASSSSKIDFWSRSSNMCPGSRLSLTR